MAGPLKIITFFEASNSNSEREKNDYFPTHKIRKTVVIKSANLLSKFSFSLAGGNAIPLKWEKIADFRLKTQICIPHHSTLDGSSKHTAFV